MSMRDGHLDTLAFIPKQTTEALLDFREQVAFQRNRIEEMLKEHDEMRDALNREIKKRMSE